MKGDWQTVAALAVVAITVVLLLAGRLRRKRRGMPGCDCPQNKLRFKE